MSSQSRPRPAVTARDVAESLGERLRQLFRATAQDPLGAVVEAAHDEAETRNAQALAAAPAACTAGCAFCCHQQVSATAAEVLLIARRVMAAAPPARARLRLAVRRAEAATRGLDPMQRWRARVPCPFLGADNLCSVYQDRPFGCRGYASRDVGRCRAAFDAAATSTPGEIPRIEPVRLNAVMLSYALERALQGLGLAHHSYDLNHGLAIALEIGPQAAAARYLAGEDVLAAARLAPPPPRGG